MDDRRTIFGGFFSSCSTTSNLIENKFELLNLLCFLTFQLEQRYPEEYKCTLDVIEKVIEERKLDDKNQYDRYLIGTSILCDDFLYGITKYKNNTGYSKAPQVIQRIKNLLAEWIPF